MIDDDLKWLGQIIDSQAGNICIKYFRKYTPEIRIITRDSYVADRVIRIYQNNHIGHHIGSYVNGTRILVCGYKRVKTLVDITKPYLLKKYPDISLLHKSLISRELKDWKDPLDVE